MSALEPYQQRVVDEKNELDKKLKALNAMLKTPIFEKLNILEKKLLEEQAELMTRYSAVLKQRISMWN